MLNPPGLSGEPFFMIESQIVARVLPSKCREAVKVLLQEVYGYEDFRNLEVYDDLFRGKEKLQLSQGQLIEEVIMEAEKGIKGDSSAHNLLLTAPTGAGKSLLFQLPAIYLGNEYKLLTLVVSPLKALIVDQVEALRELGYERVAYASSDLSPEQKNEVYRRVREGEVDLFYLSPELLLAYDISYFVGERRIGLVVVDEAHTVTTWGKEFRVDYWFLGRHLEALKNALGYVFPVFALTATAVWNPEGGNDMIFDTIRSLHLAPCALYVGTVKRENIGFDITAMTIEEGETYDKAKQRTVAARVEDFLDGHKTIIYYPFAGGIDMKLKTWVYPANWHWVASYYGKKDKEQKAEIIQAFKEGEKKIIVATKAFGMGVDISDIDRVYHVAPSSTFVDYIQEIGRAARDKNITGVAVTDFNERDFYYMKRLHSAGAISQEQLGMILKKVWEIYLMKGCSDEMQMSLSDFEFAVKLPRKKNKLEYESDLEQVVKTALLWIEEDLSFRHGGSPVEINSQTLFSDGYVQEKTGDAAFRKKYKQYMVPVKGVEGVYKVAFESLWENCFSEMGYREFKRDLYNGNLFEGVRAAAVGKHDVLLKESAADICSKLASLLKSLKDLLTVSLYGNKGKFEEDDLRSIFAAYDMDVPSAKRFITSLLESRVEEGRSVSYITSAKKKDEDKLMFTVTRGFDLLLSRYQKLCAQRITGKKGDRLLFYVTPFSDLNMLLNLLSMLNVVDFTVEGGVPSVGVRVRDAEILKKEAASGDYHNHVLENNEKIFQEQIELFRLFFGNTKLSDEQRWEFIEDYFTGMSLEGLKEKYSCVVE